MKDALEVFEKLRRNNIDLLFICGHTRSGTTLMQRILDSHPQLLVWPVEDGIMRGLANKNTTLVKELRKGPENLFHFLLNNSFLNEKRMTRAADGIHFKKATGFVFDKSKVKESLCALLSGRNNLTDKEILIAVFCAIFLNHIKLPELDNVKYMVLKTPKTSFYIDHIESITKGSHYIFIFREPTQAFFSVLLSHIRDKEISGDNYPRHIQRAKEWRDVLCVILGNFLKHAKKSDRALLITYKNLCKNTTREIELIAGFLNIENIAILTKPTIAGRPWKGNSIVKDSIEKIELVEKKVDHPYSGLIDSVLYRKVRGLLRSNDRLSNYYKETPMNIKYIMQESFPNVFIKRNKK